METDRTKVNGKWNSETIFEKSLPNGWVLRKVAHEQVDSPQGKGCYWDEHKLVSSRSEIDHRDWEWAELDGRTIVWAEKGCMYRANLSRQKGLEDPKLLYDFNPLEFEEISAPY